MTAQLSMFDAIESERRKSAGMALAAENNADLLALARAIAVQLAQRGPVTADTVQAALVERGYSVNALGNAAGSIFKGPGWRWTGAYVKSQRVHAHRNLLRVWERVG